MKFTILFPIEEEIGSKDLSWTIFMKENSQLSNNVALNSKGPII